MEQEDNAGVNLAETPAKLQLEDNEEAENAAETLTKSVSSGKNKKEAENAAEASTRFDSSEKSNEKARDPSGIATMSQSHEKNNREAEVLAKASTKPESSRKRTPKSLKAIPKVEKKLSASNSLNAKTAKWQRKKKEKNALQANREGNKVEEGPENLISKEQNTQRNVAGEGNIEKLKKTQEEGTGGSGKSQQNKRRDEKRVGSDKSLRNKNHKGKLKQKKKNQQAGKKKEKLGGLIFMCSAKTKPDCFRYRVMGMTNKQKDLVLSVKPGLKLFLYDFDLKLMYGIYEASSAGGMRLEPRAFGGSFPVQVRFSVLKDCTPLPESVFKKAIKDNYANKNRFDIELTNQQVKNLRTLFRSAVFHLASPAAAVPVHSPATIRDREVYDEVREPRPHPHTEAFTRAGIDGRSDPLRFYQRDQLLDYQDIESTRRDEIPRVLFLSEKEYRTFGLQADRRNLAAHHHVASTLDPYQREREREHLLRQADPIYRDTVPVQRESVLVDPLYSSHRELQAYELSTRYELPSVAPLVSASASVSALDSYTRDPYYTSYYGASSVGSNLPTLRREEVSSATYHVNGTRGTYLPEADSRMNYVNGPRGTYLVEADSLHGRETDQRSKLYSTYAVNPLLQYNHLHYSQGAQPETALARAPVSSRYSFAGPSVTYRQV